MEYFPIHREMPLRFSTSHAFYMLFCNTVSGHQTTQVSCAMLRGRRQRKENHQAMQSVKTAFDGGPGCSGPSPVWLQVFLSLCPNTLVKQKTFWWFFVNPVLFHVNSIYMI